MHPTKPHRTERHQNHKLRLQDPRVGDYASADLTGLDEQVITIERASHGNSPFQRNSGVIKYMACPRSDEFANFPYGFSACRGRKSGIDLGRARGVGRVRSFRVEWDAAILKA